MERVKLFEEFDKKEKVVLTKEQLAFLKKVVHKGTWKINDNGKIDVIGSVFIHDKHLEEFPVSFGKVSVYFSCDDCTDLISLKGSPEEAQFFSCNNCGSLNSLRYAPYKVVSQDFEFYDSPGIPREEEEIAKNKDLREAWLKSGLSIEDFKKEKRGLIASKNFGF